MNKRRLKTLVNFVEKRVPPIQLDMSSIGHPRLHDCKSRGCMLGWATQVESFAKANFHPAKAQSFFDLTEKEYEFLFADGPDVTHLYNATKDQVLAAFRHFIATGELKAPS